MSKSGARHLTGVDGLRGLAAVGVLLYHTVSVLTPQAARDVGWLVTLLHQGLNLFFVLSGFLLFLPFAERLLDGAALPSIRRYAANRALRIWPAYVVVLTLTSAVVGVAFLPDRHFGRLTLGDYAADLTLLHSLSPHTLRTGLEVAWTLTLEVTFYAVLPLLAWGAARFGARRRLAPWPQAMLPVAALFALGFGGALWKASYPHGPHGWAADWQSVISRSLLTHADLFAFGMAATLVHLAVARGVVGRDSGGRIRMLALPLAIATLTAAVVDTRSAFRDDEAAIGFACLLLAAVLPGAGQWPGLPGLVGRTLEWRPLRALGLVSFSLYLWHMGVVRAMQAWFVPLGAGLPAAVGNAAIVLGVSSVLAVLTYRFVELPALRLRRPVRRDEPATALAASSPRCAEPVVAAPSRRGARV